MTDLNTERILKAVSITPDGDIDDDEFAMERVALFAQRHRAVDGATFLLDTSTDVRLIWGAGEQALWTHGEALMIVGPDGVGKTTTGQQLALARTGLRCEFLGWPVEPEPRRVLYIAADRPAQAQRSMRRMVTEEDRELLADRLEVWRGPLPLDLAKSPNLLCAMADEFGAGTIVMDSLKDVAMDLTKDEVGARVNNAIQNALAEDLEVATLHHQRKAQSGSIPKALSDVYGSRWLTAGTGSVFMLWGEPGDSVVEFLHLKQPMEDVGPLKLLHDHHSGTTTLVAQIDPLLVIRASRDGITAQELACRMFENTTPKRNEVEKARRRLDTLVRKNLAVKIPGTAGGSGGGDSSRYCTPDLLHREAS